MKGTIKFKLHNLAIFPATIEDRTKRNFGQANLVKASSFWEFNARIQNWRVLIKMKPVFWVRASLALIIRTTICLGKLLDYIHSYIPMKKRFYVTICICVHLNKNVIIKIKQLFFLVFGYTVKGKAIKWWRRRRKKTRKEKKKEKLSLKTICTISWNVRREKYGVKMVTNWKVFEWVYETITIEKLWLKLMLKLYG